MGRGPKKLLLMDTVGLLDSEMGRVGQRTVWRRFCTPDI